ncbi:MAG: hypothetical protein FWG02_10515 [Holophagaceae bacterium]|nr:hypothetical protein [Holophagaceae bacterium]
MLAKLTVSGYASVACLAFFGFLGIWVMYVFGNFGGGGKNTSLQATHESAVGALEGCRRWGWLVWLLRGGWGVRLEERFFFSTHLGYQK